MLDPEIIRSFDPKTIEYDSGDELTDADLAYQEEADPASEEDFEAPADYTLTDPDEVDLFDDDVPDTLTLSAPKASWPEVKAALNHWGRIFSEEARRRSEAADAIFRLFEQVTFQYKTLLERDPEDQDKIGYANAVYALRSRFFGEQEAPLRFLKQIYPEDLFYNALYHTLGITVDKDDREDAEPGEEIFPGEEHLFDGASAYTASKGATYVTYFVSTLRFFCLRRVRKLSRDHAQVAHIFVQNTREAQLQEASSSTEDEVIRAQEQRRQMEAMIRFGELVLTAKLGGQKLRIHASAAVSGEDAPKSVKPHQLELFYSFKLVNFSRFSTSPVDQKADLVLMHAADADFLRFATTILDLTYPDLVQAELSETVLEQGLYERRDGERLLLQNAVVAYTKQAKSEISRIFNAAKAYLRGSWNFLLQD